MNASADLRESDPNSDNRDDWGDATRTENSLRALNAMGNDQKRSERDLLVGGSGGGTAPADALQNIVVPDAPVVYTESAGDVLSPELTRGRARGGAVDMPIEDMDVQVSQGYDARRDALMATPSARPSLDNAGYRSMAKGVEAFDSILRGLNVGQSAHDLLTVHADRVIPGPGQSTIYDRYEAYRRAGFPIDKAANKAMEDYGNALKEFAESDANGPSRAVAQGARVLGLAQTIAAPAPAPGGASLPIGAGLLARAATNTAKGVVVDSADTIAKNIVGSFQAQSAAQTPGFLQTAGQKIAAKFDAADVIRGVSDSLDRYGLDQTTKHLVIDSATKKYDAIIKAALADPVAGEAAIAQVFKDAAAKVPGLDLAKMARSGALTGEARLSVGLALNDVADDLLDLSAKAAKSGEFSDKAKIIMQTAQLAELQRVFSGKSGAASRTLADLQKVMASAMDQRSMYDAAANAIGGRKNADTLIDKLDDLWRNPDIAARDKSIYKFVSQLDKPGRFAFIPEIWRNSILSNPITQEVNIISNALLLATERLPTRLAAATGEAVRAGFGLRNVEREVYFSEVVPGLLGILKGIPDGTREGLKILANQDSRVTSKFLERGQLGRGEAVQGPRIAGMNPVGAAINLPTRTLAAADAVFDQMSFKAELNALAARAAAKEGLRGNAFSQRVAELLANPTDDMLNGSRKMADLTTLKSEPSPLAQSLLDARKRVPALQFIAPFVTTPDNLIKLAGSYSPYGVLRAVKAKGAERTLLMGRAAVGSAVLGYFATQMFQGDKVTAGAPKDPKERQLFYAQGKQPYSIKIGNEWVQFRRFEPLSTPLAWTASMYEAWKDGDDQWDKALIPASLAVGRALLDTAYLGGMSQFVDALQDPERNAERFVASMTTGFIPFSGFLRALAQKDDPYLRDPDDLLETIHANLPHIDAGPLQVGGSTSVKPQLMITGEPAKRAESRQDLGAAVNPFVINPERRNATLEELGTLRSPDKIGEEGQTIPGGPIMLGFPAETIAGMGLTKDEAFGMNQQAQQNSMSNLTALFATDDYKKATPGVRAAMADKAVADARAVARRAVTKESLDDAQTPEQVSRAALMSMASLDTNEGPSRLGARALFIDELRKSGKLTATVAAAIDKSRQPKIDGTMDPTVDEYVKAAPLVAKYAALPPFRIGSEKEWAELQEARRVRAQILADAKTAAARDPRAVDIVFRRTDPKAAAVVAKYADSRVRDPRRIAMLEKDNWLRPFVGGLDYE